MRAETVVSVEADTDSLDDTDMGRKPLEFPETEEDLQIAAELQTAFGRSVKAARLRSRRTQKEMADLCGLRQDDISRIEAGTTNVTLRTMARFARVFDGDVWAMILAAKADSSTP